jgi:hypothetical protein
VLKRSTLPSTLDRILGVINKPEFVLEASSVEHFADIDALVGGVEEIALHKKEKGQQVSDLTRK